MRCFTRGKTLVASCTPMGKGTYIDKGAQRKFMTQTLLLTSAGMRVKEEVVKILPKPANEILLAHITTASKPEHNRAYVRNDSEEMERIGFQVEEIDIEDKTKGELARALRGKDMVYVQGGNTFYLLRCVRESGFDEMIKELIKEGAIYIGVSAGSYIACPTIEMATWKRQDKNEVGLTDLHALNFVPFLLFVHYESRYESIVKEGAKNTAYPVRVLIDDQAFLVRDGAVTLVGQGEEIIV